MYASVIFDAITFAVVTIMALFLVVACAMIGLAARVIYENFRKLGGNE